MVDDLEGSFFSRTFVELLLLIPRLCPWQVLSEMNFVYIKVILLPVLKLQEVSSRFPSRSRENRSLT